MSIDSNILFYWNIIMLKNPNHHIPKEFTESIYGLKVYCTYNSEPPTSIIIDVAKSFNTGNNHNYLAVFSNLIKNVYDSLTNNPSTIEYKHFMTMLSIISDHRTNVVSNDDILISWDYIAYCRYLNMNPSKAIETFKKYFPSCTEIKIEPPVFLASVDNSLNDFAQQGITLSGVLNTTAETFPEV
ncbi:hypothetical protein A3306_01480 [Rickettsia bellii]|uniref:Uncharacterized protein n=3 Tax=Rickettsia bellii TaxID=33990 RepID=Q1RKC9_RICBR|nr:unknown [Rickettsia bellii RML369-C]ARD85938.1 hypothetical protein A3306_01480 [Rickettsia bellii]KJV90620.1 hypothetical protein RBEAN4_1628 [Rickettsia bellii str. RML An4]